VTARPEDITEAADAEAALARARAMYRAVLSGWASDALRLRARGLDRPSGRSVSGPIALPPAATHDPAPWVAGRIGPTWDDLERRRAG